MIHKARFNRFFLNASFLFPLKTNVRLPDVFRGQRKGASGTNGLIRSVYFPIFGPSQTSMMEPFCEKTKRQKVANCFHRKAPLQMFERELIIFLQKIIVTDDRNHPKSTMLVKCTIESIKKVIQWKHDVLEQTLEIKMS